MELKQTLGVDVLFQVKGNQPTLKKQCVVITETCTPASTCTQRDKKAHGRKEVRTVQLFLTPPHTLPPFWDEHIACIVCVTRTTRTLAKGTLRKKSTEVAYFVSTRATLSAEQAGKAIRAHWGIENSNHYVRDTTLGEDFSRIRKKPENVARLRSFALNVLRSNDIENIRQTVYANCINLKRMLQYKGIREEE